MRLAISKAAEAVRAAGLCKSILAPPRLADTLAAAGAVGKRFRLEIGPTQNDAPLSSAPLAFPLIPATALFDDETIAPYVAARGRGLDLEPGHPAAVLWMQAYAYRVAAPLLASWVLHQRVPDVSAENVLLRFDDQGRPVEVRLAQARVAGLPHDRVEDAEFVATDDLTAEAVRVLLDRHLLPILNRVRARYRLGPLLAQGSIASQLGMALTFIDSNSPAPWIDVARVAVGLFERTGDRISGEGKTGDMIVKRMDGLEGVTWRRRTCCLVYKAPQREMCGGCPLHSDAERLTVWGERLAARPSLAALAAGARQEL